MSLVKEVDVTDLRYGDFFYFLGGRNKYSFAGIFLIERDRKRIIVMEYQDANGVYWERILENMENFRVDQEQRVW